MIDHRNLDGCHGQVCSGIFQTTLLWAIQALSLRSFMQTIADIRTTCLPLVPPPALSLSEQLARQRACNVSSVLEGQHAPSHCVNFGQELLSHLGGMVGTGGTSWTSVTWVTWVTWALCRCWWALSCCPTLRRVRVEVGILRSSGVFNLCTAKPVLSQP